MIRLGILGSTRGTNLLPIAEAIAAAQLPARIEIVASNKSDAVILERAATLGLLAKHIDATGLQRKDYDALVSSVMQQHAVDLIVLIGYMRILSPEFVTTWRGRVINVHPSLLPSFAGLMDLDVHRAVLAAGVKETGCTVHYVEEEVDAGPILWQKTCPVYAADTPEVLKARVQALEGQALIEAINKLANLYCN